MLITCCAYRYIQYAVFICFHNVSDCDLTHLVYSIWMSVWKSCYWDLRYMCVVWQMCMVCWHIHVCVCAYSDDTLSFCSWDHGSAHVVCVDRMRKLRAVRWNLQRMHACCGTSSKLMGIQGSTFRTSQVWRQKAYYSHKFVLLVWVWYTGLFVCAGSSHNGLVFNALIHAHCPDLIDFNALQLCCHIDKLNNAFDVANSELGIPWLLDAEIW